MREGDNMSIFFQLLCFLLLLVSVSSSSSCSRYESAALIQFKNHFSINQTDTDCSPKTNSWKEDTDCCLWDGVICDNITGQVISLDLRSGCLSGTFPPNTSLFQLTHLQSLDLALNDFNESKIPYRFGRFTSLRDLDLSDSRFSGTVPYEISYLSKLVSLSLSTSSFSSKLENPTLTGIIQNLTELSQIDLYGIDMSSVDPNSFTNLSYSLTFLNLGCCDLRGNFPNNIFNFPNINSLNFLSNLGLTAQFPKSNWTSPLIELSTAWTSFSGELPESIGNLKSLFLLALSNSNFSGTIPRSMANLSLVYLSLDNNQLEGSIPDNPNAFPNIFHLDLYNNLLSGTTPSWIYSHPNLNYLDLSNNQFSGHIQEFHHNSALEHLDLSNNNFEGSIPRSISKLVNLTFLDLSSNHLNGTLKLLNSEIYILFFSVSNNSMSGEISDICNMKSLKILDLSHNSFSGIIPQCLGNFNQSLFSLNLKMNKFLGVIPPIFSKDCGLRNLNLNGNHLEGPLIESISHCKDMEVLDIGNNNISDTFPQWIDRLSKLQVLVMHSNKFHGSIGASKNPQPPPELRIIDLSNNNFVGPLPTSYIKNFRGMIHLDEGKEVHYIGEETESYDFSVQLVVKGLEVDLVKILTIFTSIDLSSNSFDGEIPTIFGELSSLRGLNLSHNNLTGHIPSSLGNLTQLEWLDLSTNKLNGPIPSELVDLTFLSFLNVSYNQLVGHIPRVKQFNTFENDSYEGNEGLCGFPLSRSCNNDGKQQELPWMNSHEDNDTKLIDFGWKVVAIGYGFGFVFGAIVGYVSLRMGKLKWFVNLIGFR